MTPPDETPAPLKAALEDIVRAKKIGDELTVTKLVKMLRPNPRHEIVWALKELGDQGFGRFIPGRRGMESRFAVGQAPGAVTPRMEVVTPSPSPIEPSAPYLQHVFVFRTSPPTALALPLDLTASEADRIVRWVQTLAAD